jgi:hypothetical protein
MPTVEELTSTLAGGGRAKWFSKLDFRSAYHHLPLQEDASRLMTIGTPFGRFRYKRLVFGLATAPAIFQRYIEMVLKGISGVSVYLDDVVVTGPDKTTHDNRVQQVLERIENRGLKLNEPKCFFGVTSIEFLGHRITSTGVYPLTKGVDKILSLPPPTSGKLMKSALGSFGFFSRFLPNYSDRTSVLRKYTTGKEFTLTQPETQVWETLKADLAKAAITGLRSFTPGGTGIRVLTDASETALSGILEQNGTPVAFFSRTLSASELHFSIGEKEALAIIESIERWHVFLYGARFTVVTDHKPLLTLLSEDLGKRTTMRLKRWGARLFMYRFNLELVSSVANPADLYSRLFRASVNPDELRILSIQSAAYFADVIPLVQGGFPPLSTAVPTEHRWMWQDRHILSIEDNGDLFCGHRQVIPPEGREAVLKNAHDGHPGITRMKRLLRDRCTWSGISTDIETFVSNCTSCQSSDKVVRAQVEEPVTVYHPPIPFDTVAVDFLGPFDFGYLIVLVDYHSRWPEVSIVARADSKCAIEFLKQVFLTHGSPRTLVTDNAQAFCGHIMRDFLTEEGVDHHRTTPYHPRANGLVERFNGTIMQALRAERPRTGADAQEILRRLVRAYRTIPHPVTGEAPCRRAVGRILRTPFTAIFDDREKCLTGCTVRVKRVRSLSKLDKRWEDKPLVVQRPVGANTYQLSDGRIVPSWRLSIATQVPQENENNHSLPEPEELRSPALVEVTPGQGDEAPTKQSVPVDVELVERNTVGPEADTVRPDPEAAKRSPTPVALATAVPRRSGRIRRAPNRFDDE